MLRRGWRIGPIFDITVGFDPTESDIRSQFLRCLEMSKPTVLIISMPCTGMRGFSGINRLKAHGVWLDLRSLSTLLANLGGLAATIQMNHGRHFTAEHPHGSDMWSMIIWRHIERLGVAKAIVHQCMVGFRGFKSGPPIMNPTRFLAPDEALVARLPDNPAGTHGDWANSAATWHPQLCLRIANGCEDLLRSMKRRPQVASDRSPAPSP